MNSEFASFSLVSALPETALSDVYDLMLERNVSALPVIDREGTLRGIVSTTDLLHEARIDVASPGARARIKAPPRTAADLMHGGVITVDEGAPLLDAAPRCR
jgi:CBS domain-containing protein